MRIEGGDENGRAGSGLITEGLGSLHFSLVAMGTNMIDFLFKR